VKKTQILLNRKIYNYSKASNQDRYVSFAFLTRSSLFLAISNSLPLALSFLYIPFRKFTCRTFCSQYTLYCYNSSSSDGNREAFSLILFAKGVSIDLISSLKDTLIYYPRLTAIIFTVEFSFDK